MPSSTRYSSRGVIDGSIAVTPDIPLAIVEGNRLLVEEDPWNRVPALLDGTRLPEVDEGVRLSRLASQPRSDSQR